ncbi:MAG: response regulator [Spirochaetales bacterium]|nr:response regulator [Spirochaetales bacterium]
MVTDIHTAIANMSYGAAVLELSGWVTAVNVSCARICGMSYEEFSPLPVEEFLGTVIADDSPWRPSGRWTADRAALILGANVLLNSEEPSPVQITLLDGRGDHSLLTFVGGQVADVTAPSNRAPSVNEYLKTALMRSNASTVLVLDHTGTILDHSALEALFSEAGDGVTPAKEWIGSAIDDLLRLQQAERPFPLHKLIARARAGREDLMLSSDIQATAANGEKIDVEISIYPVLSEGEPGADIPATVITAAATGERSRVRRDLQRVQHAHDISRAAVGLAHELNNSVTALIGRLDLLERTAPALSPDGAEELKHAHSAIRRIRRLGLQLERFGGIVPDSRGRFVPSSEDQLTPTDLNETIQDTVSLALNGTGIRTSFTVESSLPTIAISPTALTQALFNVLINAVDAMDVGGIVHMELRKPENKSGIIITVRDEGHGMDPRLVDKVLQPYFSTKEQGIGMGLTVTLSIVEAHGGRLEMDTEPGFGTSVHMYVPSVDMVTSAPEDTDSWIKSSVPNRDSFEGARVLLVEDDPLVRRSMERTLQSVGCIVIAVESGDRAIELFRQELAEERYFHLLITDLAMPGRNNGVQLLQRVRELDPDIPAVLSSGILHRDDIPPYREAGFQFVLRKPFGEPEIRRALSVALSQYGRP